MPKAVAVRPCAAKRGVRGPVPMGLFRKSAPRAFLLSSSQSAATVSMVLRWGFAMRQCCRKGAHCRRDGLQHECSASGFSASWQPAASAVVGCDGGRALRGKGRRLLVKISEVLQHLCLGQLARAPHISVTGIEVCAQYVCCARTASTLVSNENWQGLVALGQARSI